LERDVVNIGKSVVIKGELNGSEDLVIEGQVEGKIELRQHVLTIGPNGKIRAQIFAKSVVSPRVAIAEGAHFRGSIDMQRAAAAPRVAESRPEVKPVVAAAAAAGVSSPRS
jgi:cytoskeletal protein CcmA (bactofilin family)